MQHEGLCLIYFIIIIIILFLKGTHLINTSFSFDLAVMLCLCLAALITLTRVPTLSRLRLVLVVCFLVMKSLSGAKQIRVNCALIKLPAPKLVTLMKWLMISCLDQHLAYCDSRCLLGVPQSKRSNMTQGKFGNPVNSNYKYHWLWISLVSCWPPDTKFLSFGKYQSKCFP